MTTAQRAISLGVMRMLQVGALCVYKKTSMFKSKCKNCGKSHKQHKIDDEEVRAHDRVVQSQRFF